jgi:hypothetical protein
MNKKHLLSLLVCSVASVGIGYVVHAEGAPTMQPLFYSGTLEDAGVLAEGNYAIRLTLHDAATAGNVVCMSETAAVPVVAGRFRMDVSDCADELQTQPDAWAAVQFTGSDGTPHAIPGRTKVGAVPYAMEAQHAVSSTRLGTLAEADVQRKVAAGCPTGQSIRTVNTDGTVVCEVDDNTTYSVSAGTGLTLTGTTLNADSGYLQRRVAAAGCAAGSSIRVVNADGTVVCELDDNTTYTGSTGVGVSAGVISLAAATEYNVNSGQSAQATGKVFCALGQVYHYVDTSNTNPNCSITRSGTTWTLTASVEGGGPYAFFSCRMFCI